MASMIELDGSHGEGGGQILRTSLALALITGKAFHLRNIRARRSKPGLQPQHLMSVQASAAIGQAKMRGASLGSIDLVFEPGAVVPGTYHFPIRTAGATALVLHTVYLPLARAQAPSTVMIEGGTHVKASPCFHFLEVTWRAYLAQLGINIDLRLHRPGFFPRGGGLIDASISPSARIGGLQLESLGEVTHITGLSIAAGLPASIARRQADRARQRLSRYKLPVDIREEAWPHGPGTVLFLELNTKPAPTSFFALGERGKPAEKVADEAAQQVETYLDAEILGVDAHSADQLLLPLALAQEPSRFPVASLTQHFLTNVEVIRRFVATEVRVEGAEGEAGRVAITPQTATESTPEKV
ncbi:MAG: RNA 3'-terminal phosphate cyclase [Planctomycetes bacterium]|nr:RNA 3'-terminal phosphate cyclase [Planctomycetota bacterium]